MKSRKYAYLLNTCLFLFFTAAAAGFLWEVLLSFFEKKQFVNRGFFYGPWLPVYGAGAVLLYLFLHKKKNRPLFCFFTAGLIGACVELFTGWLLNACFGLRYWDYRGQLFNIGGYICLYSVLGFALAGSAYICFFAPFLLRQWEKIPEKIRRHILGLLLVAFLLDAACSLIFPNTGRGITF